MLDPWFPILARGRWFLANRRKPWNLCRQKQCRLAKRLGWVGVFLGLLRSTSLAADSTPESAEFFEKKVRPILADRCYRCHSRQSEKLKGGLLLDSREGVMKGGEGGPIINPGALNESRLLVALSYQNPDLEMPPQGKLPDAEINALTEWVKMGAPWPIVSVAAVAATTPRFDLDKRRQDHWAWQPIKAVEPPSVHDKGWATTPLDRFILASLEQAGLPPAPPADRRTLIRRLYFDLIGLPPTPQQVEAFVRSSSPIAYEEQVDQLLASPRFGERWGRHWLDLVRYAETLGHEFDYAIENAWRYRDYIIRAFNGDVPYPQLVTEHIAGDLLTSPRLDPERQSNESIIATGFFWLGQRVHSPVDARQDQAEVIDNQIDVMSKTFLGLTVACARCHDHKFDAISTKDYYALYGVMEGSRYAQRTISSIDQFRPPIEELEALKRRIRRVAAAEFAQSLDELSKYLLASDPARAGVPSAERIGGLEPKLLANWSNTVAVADSGDASDPFFAWRRFCSLKSPSPKDSEALWLSLLQAGGKSNTVAEASRDFANATGNSFDDWFHDGVGCASWSRGGGAFVLGETNGSIKVLEEPSLRTDLLSRRLEGVLRSPTFEVKRRYVHVRAAGNESRVRVCMDNLTMIRDPIYGGLMKSLASSEPAWLTFDLNMWLSHRAYIELADLSTADPADDAKKNGWDPRGYFSVSRVVFSDDPAPPRDAEQPAVALMLGATAPASRQELAERYQATAERALRTWESADMPRSDAEWAQLRFLAFLVNHQLVRSGASESLAVLVARYRELEATIPAPRYVPAMAEGDGGDEQVFIRGNPRTLGDPVPRRFLTALSSGKTEPFTHGSGRLELAHCLTDPSNPLLSRVMVNRVWSHLFGRGVVPTPDDFGALGQRPTNPVLLDWLANWYRTDGRWSTKRLIRLLVTSNTYRMSSRPTDTVAEEKDPDNLLLHRMPVRRLEGEAIRDAMLAVSGRLDLKMYGPSVPTFLTEFMEGSGRPAKSGPLDGAGRRSIYLEVRRNFLSPMMRTFDAPVPYTTVGRRTVSTVPAQSLILMNDPFVYDQAQAWAGRLLKEKEQAPEQFLDQSFRMGLGRPPTLSEQALALDFLKRQATSYAAEAQAAGSEARVWADLCHVEFNMKEFIFLE